MVVEVQFRKEALDAILAPFDSCHAPGFALGVALGGRPVYRRGVGMASVELPIALSPSIRMRIGSTSKHFCVLALMLLQEEGRLSIDASPRTILPELPDWADGITIRQLMAHTSGMRDSLDLLMMCGALGREVAADAQLRMLSAIDSVNFPPGQGWNYNNGGYVLLSHIAERVSGLDLATLLRTRLFEPIGMADTALRPLDTDLWPNSATPHVPDGKGGWRRGVMGVPIAGEGGIVSTIDDMLRWMAHMEAPVVGTPESWAQMRTPHASHGYGLGLLMDTHRGLRTLHHAGGVIGGACQMIKVVDAGLDIILITNGSNGLALYSMIDAIIDACIPGLPPVDAGAPQPGLDGVYYSAQTGRVLSVMTHQGQSLLVMGGMPLPVRWNRDGGLSPCIAPTDMVVSPTLSGGQVAGLAVREFGQEEFLERMTAVPGTTADIAGHYAAAPGIIADIGVDGGAVIMVLRGQGADLTYGMRPLGPGLWEAAGAGALPCWAGLEFDEDGFRLSTARTTRLRFRRA